MIQKKVAELFHLNKKNSITFQYKLMDITFTKNLKKIVKNPEKELGANCGKRFKTRLNQIRAAINLEELRYAPGRFHELIGDKN